jgi:hypothetical protein
MESFVEREEIFFRETSSLSREFSLQCARQSKRLLALAYSCACFSCDRENTLRLYTVVALDFCPAETFFPRKVAPPSSENDPFLS